MQDQRKFIRDGAASLLSISIEHGDTQLALELVRLGLPSDIKLEEFVNKCVEKGYDSVTAALLARPGAPTPYHWDLSLMAMTVNGLIEADKTRLTASLLLHGPEKPPPPNTVLEGAISRGDY
jgi:hypothetical protein